MQNTNTDKLMKFTLNGAFHEDNFVWGGAMNICWNTMSTDVIEEQLKLLPKSNLGKHLVENFEKSKFTKKDLSDNSYYTKAGYGQKALQTINKQCRAKFPNKSFADIEMNLHDTDIISYAYFVKQVQYLNPFALQPNFYFNGKSVKGFIAKNKFHFENIRVCKYIDQNNFTIKLLLKQKGQQLFIIKGSQKSLPQQIVSKLQEQGKVQQTMKSTDKFSMPIVQLDIKRQYKQLIGAPLGNEKFKQYFITAMFQNIKFKIDQIGAKVQNQAVMVATRSAIRPQEGRYLIVNSPFWVVMRQTKCHPYFIAQINNTKFMKQV